MVWAEGGERDAEAAQEEYDRRLQQAGEDRRAGRVASSANWELRRQLARALEERLRQIGHNLY